ncbi:hypothetical protein HY382_00020 [Candidatus Curtissbacteria bacterium]|nr:hypothetical protein [Candidatus Curtissbacteria bacterium]
MKVVSIVRDRGQLTIPDSIRKLVNWVNPSSAVSISVVKPDEIIIKPHQYQKEVDWDKLWKKIKRVRAFKGKGQGNLSASVIEDREARR